MVTMKFLDLRNVAIWVVLYLMSGALCKKYGKGTTDLITGETTTGAFTEDFTSVKIVTEEKDGNDTIFTMEPETESDTLSTTEGDTTVSNVIATQPDKILTSPDDSGEDACDRKPCLNGGVCQPDPLEPAYSFTCHCRKGFTGQRCQMVDECVPDKEGNLCRGGSCVFSDDRWSRHCRCFSGTFWDATRNRCSEPQPPCLPNPCLNGGTCKEKEDNYSCICTKGYEGIDCNIQNECGRHSSCGINGSCLIDEVRNVKHCKCDPGYYFNLDIQQCEAEEAPCVPNPCKNGGTCEVASSSHFNCTCKGHYTGKTCTILDECGNGCEHGHCEQSANTRKCVCDNGYFWDDRTLACTEVRTMCDTDPCGFGSLCRPLTQNGYNCTCTEGYVGQRCDDLDYCITDGGNDFCADAECSNKLYWDIGRETFYCICPSGQYFDYKRRTCQEIDLCSLMKCNQNEKCENSNCTCMDQYKWNNSTGKCEPHVCPSNPCPDVLTCIEGAGIEDYECSCKPGEAFNGKHCIGDAVCTFPGLNDCAQICKVSDDGYSCHCLKHDFELNEDNKTCRYVGNETCTNKTCGMGTCLKTEDGEICICPPGYREVEGKCIDLCTADSLPKGFCPNDQCEPTAKGFRCKCEGKYALSSDEVTCTARRLCSKSEKGWEVCSSRNAICTEDWSRDEGYKCSCASGLVETEGGTCKEICSIEENQMKCSVLGAECAIDGKGNSTCKCPPLFEPFEDWKSCKGPATGSYIWSLPLNPSTYKKVQSFAESKARKAIEDDSLDEEKLERDVRKTMSRLVPGFKHLNILYCRLKKGALLCKIEIQFSQETEEEYFKRLIFPELCLTTEEYPSTCIIPPSLVLRTDQVREIVSLHKSDPCDWDIKDALCAPETTCKSSMDPLSFNCTCKPGYELWKKSYPFNSTSSSTDRCKDIDECSIGNPCPQNMDCRNAIGSYDCACSAGYRLDKNSSTKKCIAICSPNPCTHGTCTEMGEHDFLCKCDAGFTGTMCDLQDENYKRARTNTIVVGAVLGGFLLVVLILSFGYISKLKKKKSIDDPSHILYGTEMAERRNAESGAVNNAYQRE